MPRQARLILPDVAVHIVQRGNDRMSCFRSDSDRLLYLTHLRRLALKFDCAVHAYCLMTNHVHLLMTPADEHGCAGLMKEVSQLYVRYFNDAYGRTGTLWEGRYHSCVAESARYVLACYRYIELNPVRAGMTDVASSYAWSSCGANCGIREDSLITDHTEYVALGTDSPSRQRAYQQLIGNALDAHLLKLIREATVGGYPLSSDEFKNKVSASTGRKLERGRAGRKPEKSEPDPDLFSAGGAS
jgi:putative transposase